MIFILEEKMSRIVVSVFLLSALFKGSHGLGAPKVYIIEPKNGAQVSQGDLKVLFGLNGMGVAPAGVKQKGTGHHHLLVDYEGSPDLSKPLPKSKNLIHFGGGQTETVLKNLAPGKHTLKLIFADFAHVPIKPAVESQEVVIYVKK